MKATIYFKSTFGVTKQEVTLIKHGTMEYAQYSSAPFVEYKKKRARKITKLVQGYNPNILIISGWDQIDTTDAFNKEERCGPYGLVVKSSKYTSFDERYQTEFDEMIQPLIDSGKIDVIADYRNHNSHNRYTNNI